MLYGKKVRNELSIYYHYYMHPRKVKCFLIIMKNEMKLCAAILLFGQMVIDILHLRSFTAKIMEILWSDACINGDHFTNTIYLKIM